LVPGDRAIGVLLQAVPRPDGMRLRNGGQARIPAAPLVPHRPAARCSGGALLRRHLERLRRNAGLCRADRCSGSLGRDRLYPGSAAFAEREAVRHSAGRAIASRGAAGRAAVGTGSHARAAAVPLLGIEAAGGPPSPCPLPPRRERRKPGAMRNSETLREGLDRIRRPALTIGSVALAACAVGAV